MTDHQDNFQDAIDKLDDRSLLLAMALLGKRAMDILQVWKELEKNPLGKKKWTELPLNQPLRLG